MAFENITSLAESFDRSLNKIAAKEKTSKKSLSKRLEKARAEHQKLSEEFKRVQKEFDKTKSVHDDLKSKVGAKRKEIISLQNAGQKMDLANASDAIFHQDTNDVSYVIDGKEYHVEVDGEGEIQTVPWRDHRKAQKPAQPETTEEVGENAEQPLDAEDCGDSEVVTDAANMDQAMLDDLYLKMTEASVKNLTTKRGELIENFDKIRVEVSETGSWVGNWMIKDRSFLNELVDLAKSNNWFLYTWKPKKSNIEVSEMITLSTDPPEFEPSLIYNIYADPTKTASYSDLIKKWAGESGMDWYRSLGDKVQSYHEDDIPEELVDPERDWPEIDDWDLSSKPTGKESTESSYDPMMDSEVEQERVLESEGEQTPWPEFIENERDLYNAIR